ncbi:hypothetical protein [Cryobacterium sp. TMT2-17-1]|uniref:hypothetical protein n=1 Tax=Cryobacterium sp. TMT2-17-1 TaxID=1259248 RepID=UPI00141B5F41|nr:hypothetical protein [Cryobacterium sp. TMT2-17-1]
MSRVYVPDVPGLPNLTNLPNVPVPDVRQLEYAASGVLVTWFVWPRGFVAAWLSG